MPSSYTTSLRLELQFTGENLNLWGDKLNAALSRADDAVAGWLTKPLTGNYALTTANGAADEARRAMLKFTGAGSFTVTAPAVAKRYDVWNACTGDLTLTNGSASVTVKAGEVVSVVTDGAADFRRVQGTDFAGATLTGVTRVAGLSAPSANSDAATKKYVDDTAFAMAGGALPGQAGNAGKVLKTDGSAAGWESVQTSDIPNFAATASDVRAGTDTAKAVTSAALVQAATFQTLTDAATVAWDAAKGFNATVTLGGNRTIGAPTNLFDGVTYCLELVQDATGSRAPTWNSIWDWGVLGAPVLNTAPGKRDLVFGIYRAATGKIHANFRKGA